MYLKRNNGNITIELLSFFLILAACVWTSVGIFEAYKTRTSLNSITYLVVKQIAINEELQNQWQDQLFIDQVAKNNKLKNLKIEIDCENNICNNGNIIQIRTSAESTEGVFRFQIQSEKYAISNKHSSD